MNTTKYKIWDNEKKEWFRPTYPRNKQTLTEEVLFMSQSGEMYLHTKNLTEDLLVHVPELGRFTPCRYTELKDSNDEKVYEFDVIRCDIGTGRVIKSSGCWMIEWIDDPEANMELLAIIFKTGRKRVFVRLGSSLEEPALLEKSAHDNKAEFFA